MRVTRYNQYDSLRVYNTSSQALPLKDTIKYSNTAEHTGDSIKFVNSTDVINIYKPGLYYLSADVTVSSGEESVITLKALQNNEPILGMSGAATIADPSDSVEVTISGIVRVPPFCPCVSNAPYTLAIEIDGTSMAVTNANLSIFKLM